MEKGTKIVCPVCKLEEGVICNGTDFGRTLSYNCERCGRYSITSTAKSMVESRSLISLSSWIREKNDLGIEPPVISSDLIKQIQGLIPNYSPRQKQLVLLRRLEKKTEYPGQKVTIHPRFDFTMAWASREKELIYYVQSLIDRELLKLSIAEEIDDEFPFEVEITSKGWDFLDEHAKPSIMSDQVFVAMSFSADLEPAWENGFREAIKDAGFKAYRVDEKPHNERIDVKIVAEIKNSVFLVADVTEQKQGVYFESGYAIGLGIPVIWSVRKDELTKVHFDTRQYNHIVWEAEKDLRKQLYDFICAIIGKRG
jgi:nucleoside 2-deoxyribosyltransferase